MNQKQNNHNTSWLSADKIFDLWVLAPLLCLPLMLNVRWMTLVAPNEEPKWLILIACFVWIGLMAAYMVWKRREPLMMHWTWAGLILAVFYLFLCLGVWIAPNHTQGLIRFSFWLAGVVVFLVGCWAWRHHAHFQIMWTWVTTLSAFVFSCHYWLGYILDYHAKGYNISVLFSPIGHVNFTSDVLVILLPVVMYLLITQASWFLRLFNVFSVSTLTTILLLASTRGVLIGLFLGMLLLSILVLKHKHVLFGEGWYKKHVLPLSLLVFSLCSSIVTYQILPYHYRDLARLSSTFQSVEKIQQHGLIPDVLQPPLADVWQRLYPILGARTPMFASATAMAWDAPFFGHGTGSFFAIYPRYSNAFVDFRDPLSGLKSFTTNPHNVVLQIATQQGWVAALCFVGLLLFFLWRLIQAVWQKWNTWQAVGVLAISASLFDSMFNHVFFNPASMFVFAWFAGLWWASCKPMPTLFTLSVQVDAHKPLALSMVVMLFLFAVLPVRWVVSEYHVAHAMRAKTSKDVVHAYQQAYHWDKDNFRAVFGVAQTAYHQRRYADSVLYLEQFQQIYPYNAPALNLLGAAYLMQHDYAKAAGAFQKAVSVYPDFAIAKQNLKRAIYLLEQSKK